MLPDMFSTGVLKPVWISIQSVVFIKPVASDNTNPHLIQHVHVVNMIYNS